LAFSSQTSYAVVGKQALLKMGKKSRVAERVRQQWSPEKNNDNVFAFGWMEGKLLILW
jgi:hypothetical protein